MNSLYNIYNKCLKQEDDSQQRNKKINLSPHLTDLKFSIKNSPTNNPYESPMFMNLIFDTPKKRETTETKKISKQKNYSRKKKNQSIYCKCLNSQCIKMYCECYQNSLQCGSNCKCKNCNNTQENKTIRQQKKLSCNCKKSNCLKNYCECYLKNTFC